MKYFELLAEKAIRIDADGNPVTVIRNPSVQQVLGLLERSPDQQAKGLIIGSDVYFWSATSFATHGHIAEQLWPTDGKRNYWEYPEYTNGRIMIEMDGKYPVMDFGQLPLPEGRGLEEKMLTTSDQPGRKAID